MQTDHYINLLYPEQMDQKLHGRALKIFKTWLYGLEQHCSSKLPFNIMFYMLYQQKIKHETWSLKAITAVYNK